MLFHTGTVGSVISEPRVQQIAPAPPGHTQTLPCCSQWLQPCRYLFSWSMLRGVCCCLQEHSVLRSPACQGMATVCHCLLLVRVPGWDTPSGHGHRVPRALPALPAPECCRACSPASAAWGRKVTHGLGVSTEILQRVATSVWRLYTGYQGKFLHGEGCPALPQAAQGSAGVPSLAVFKNHVGVAVGDMG